MLVCSKTQARMQESTNSRRWTGNALGGWHDIARHSDFDGYHMVFSFHIILTQWRQWKQLLIIELLKWKCSNISEIEVCLDQVCKLHQLIFRARPYIHRLLKAGIIWQHIQIIYLANTSDQCQHITTWLHQLLWLIFVENYVCYLIPGFVEI